MVGDLMRQRVGSGAQFVRRDHPADEAPGEGLVGAEDAAAVRPLERLADADDARQEPTAAGLGHDAAACEDEAKRAADDAMRMSIGRVMVTPTPTAGPLIAAMTGFFASKMRSATRPPPSRCSSSPCGPSS